VRVVPAFRRVSLGEREQKGEERKEKGRSNGAKNEMANIVFPHIRGWRGKRSTGRNKGPKSARGQGRRKVLGQTTHNSSLSLSGNRETVTKGGRKTG